MNGQYGLQDVSLSTPCIGGNWGIDLALELRLNEAEQKVPEASAAVLQSAYAQLQPV
jgi:L-lactate dehydrogenase